MRRQPWWAERIRSGLASYWVYQHLGNLAPDEIAADPLYAKVTAAEDATERAARVRRAGRHRGRRRPRHRTLAGRAVPVELRAGPGPHPPGDAGQPVQPGAGAGQPGDAAAGRVGVVPRPGARRVRPPGGRRLAALAAAPGHPPRGGVERAAGRLAAGPGWRRSPSSSAGPWTWSTGHRSAAVRRAGRAVRPARQRHAGQPGDRVGAGPAYAPPASISVLSGDVHHSYVARARFADPAVRTPGTPAHLLPRSTTRCRPRCAR